MGELYGVAAGADAPIWVTYVADMVSAGPSPQTTYASLTASPPVQTRIS